MAERFVVQGFRPVEAPPARESAVAAFVDSGAGAAVVRLALLVVASLLFVQAGSHWQALRHFFAGAFALLVPFALLALVFEPLTLLYFVIFAVGLFFLRSVEDLLFRLPRWLLREKLRRGPVASFGLAFALELAALAFIGMRLAPLFRVVSPPRFGPAVTRRLHASSFYAVNYPVRRGRVMPAKCVGVFPNRFRNRRGPL